MYFKDRLEAGRELAKRLSRYLDDDVIVASLTKSSRGIAKIIARELHGKTTDVISKAISLPGETSTLGTVDQTGSFTYNRKLSEGQVAEYSSEFHSYIEAEKINKSHEINRESIKGNFMKRDDLADHIIILVADGINDTALLDSAIEYLKPIRVKRLIAAVPVASVAAIDRLHISTDEIKCLSVTENYVDTDHYYDNSRAKF